MMACGSAGIKEEVKHDSTQSCEAKIPSRIAGLRDSTDIKTVGSSSEGMIWVPGAEIILGASDDDGRDAVILHAPAPTIDWAVESLASAV